MSTATITDWSAEIERMEREAETLAIARADEVFAEMAAEHERQTAGYHFECRRWGDFLSVFMERAANQESDWYGNSRKLATSLNLAAVKQIKLVEGRCFDRRGSISYSVVEVSGTGSKMYGSSSGSRPPSKGYHYEVEPNYPYVPTSRSLVVFDPPKQEMSPNYHAGFPSEERKRLKTENYPRAAEDDVIRFAGIGANLHAPAGLGRSVYDAILTEIARGYEFASVDTHAKRQDTK